MNNRKVLLIVSILCIAAGLVLLISSGVRSNEDLLDLLRRSGRAELQEEKTVNVTEDFSSLHILEYSADVRLLPAGNGGCRVVFGEDSYSSCRVSVESGTLKVIREEAGRRPSMTLYSETLPVRVYLPAKNYDQLKIDCTSGDVSAEPGFIWKQAEINSSSGEITLEEFQAEELILKSVSGDQELEEVWADRLEIGSSSGSVRLKRCSLGSLKLGSVSGDLSLHETEITGAAVLSSSSGEIKLKESRAGSLELSSVSGKVELEQTICSGKATIDTSSGNVRLRGADAGSFQISTTSGDVEGSILSEKDFILSTTSGSVHTRGERRGAPECRVRTGSGDIDLEIED